MSNDKPLLIVLPAPERWPVISDFLSHKSESWRYDMQKRFQDGVPGGRGGAALIVNGGDLLAAACIAAAGDVGVLSHVFTRPDMRGRGLARRAIETLLAWFDMTGGKWLYLGCAPEFVDMYAKFGFRPLHVFKDDDRGKATMQRRAEGVSVTPLPMGEAENAVREATRADWPLIVALLQDRHGADPRVAMDESAAHAEALGLSLLQQQDEGKCRLFVSVSANRVIGLASLATEQTGERTHAMILPHDKPLPKLRSTLVEAAKRRGFIHVDFPLEALAAE